MPDTPGPLAGRRVLVVEDDWMLASEMDGLLRRAGAEVDGPWPGVDQALARLDALGGTAGAAALDAAVLDVDPGGGETVYPVADRLDRSGVPYLFATGNVAGADDPAYADRPRLEKPIPDRVLLKAVAALVRGPR